MTASAARIAVSLEALLPKPWRHEPSPTELVIFVQESIAKHALFTSEETRAKRVPQISVFVAHCAPRRASREGLELAAEFLFAFFLLNDHWQAMQGLLAGDANANSGTRFVRDWLQRVRASFGHRAERFTRAFDVYLRSLQHEQRYATGLAPSFEEYVDKDQGRYQWVATAPYIELWELALGIELTPSSRMLAEELKRLSVELTYIANDIGSLARDEARRNYVTLLAARDGLADLNDALRATVSVYERKATALAEQRAALASSDATLARYAQLTCNIADGNLRATTLLAHAGSSGRYSPQVRDCLAKLPLASSE